MTWAGVFIVQILNSQIDEALRSSFAMWVGGRPWAPSCRRNNRLSTQHDENDPKFLHSDESLGNPSQDRRETNTLASTPFIRASLCPGNIGRLVVLDCVVSWAHQPTIWKKIDRRFFGWFFSFFYCCYDRYCKCYSCSFAPPREMTIKFEKDPVLKYYYHRCRYCR